MKEEVDVEIYWCKKCNVPVIKEINNNGGKCNYCHGDLFYLSKDIRPVFPEERLLFEIINDCPMKYYKCSVWRVRGKYCIDGEKFNISPIKLNLLDTDEIRKKLKIYSENNDYKYFNMFISKFIDVNKSRLNYIKNEAMYFIKEIVKKYPNEAPVISFSGGKDSTVVSDLVIKALSNASVPHIFCDTTLEDKYTIEYVKRIKSNNPKMLINICKNNDHNFFDICDDIGPPSRYMRWCCTMFKTGPITQLLNRMFPNKNVISFIGIRKCESSIRSKYKRVEKSSSTVKIRKQRSCSPIFYWKDVDVWLYILSEKIDFNYNYRIGNSRVGCWMCPNSGDTQYFMNKIYLPKEAEMWRKHLINFAVKTDKKDPIGYVDSKQWTFRRGGKGLISAKDVDIYQSSCTKEENAVIYKLNKPIKDWFYTLFIPFGKLSKSLGRNLLNEVICSDVKSKFPILSIQPYSNEENDFSVKIKSLGSANDKLIHKRVKNQVMKYNACRQCLKCESVCTRGAIKIRDGKYTIDEEKCIHCGICMDSKFIHGGCMMCGILSVSKNGEK